MTCRRRAIPLVALGAAILFHILRRRARHRSSTDCRGFSKFSAFLYDVLFGAFLDGLYARISSELAAAHPTGSALDIGCGPGEVAVRLAKNAPGLMVTGVDISPDMIERATRRARAEGVADRVVFRVGDALALPFPDQEFDLVLSTLSLHHWARPAQGLREAFRVLKPGGEACIYDIASWLQLITHHGADVARAMAESPFARETEDTVRWPDAIPSIVRVCLRKPGEAQRE